MLVGMASEAGRQLAAMRKSKRRTCALPGCCVEFETIGRRLYCTPQHAKYAWFLENRSKGHTRTQPAQEEA